MGTDIWLHVEYLDRRKKRYKHSRANFTGDRCYLLFDLLGGALGERNPIYVQRGLPGDLTNETYKEYKDGKPDFHDVSWLTTMEFRECLDVYYELLPKEKESMPEESKEVMELIKKLFPDSVNPDSMFCYEQIYQYMKESDDEGEPARIVFWFDN